MKWNRKQYMDDLDKVMRFCLKVSFWFGVSASVLVLALSHRAWEVLHGLIMGFPIWLAVIVLGWGSIMFSVEHLVREAATGRTSPRTLLVAAWASLVVLVSSIQLLLLHFFWDLSAGGLVNWTLQSVIPFLASSGVLILANLSEMDPFIWRQASDNTRKNG